MTTPVMVIWVELLAVTTPMGISATWLLVQLTFTPTTWKARLRVVVTWAVPLLT
uniref:Uncharacterized protein n=1 Tax=Aegilops tauschii subsp. strangulata TaxID=200361 RepID=A0A453R114_AEGTS